MKTLTILMLLALAAPLVADDSGKTPEQIAAEARIAELNAQKALLDAQTAKYKAEQDALQARRDAELNKLKAEKDLVSAATPTFTGTARGGVTYDEKTPGTIENAAMAYRAVKEAAKKVVENLKPAVASGVFVIYGPADANNLAALSVFEMQAGIQEKRLKDLDAVKDQIGVTVPKEKRVADFSAIGAIGMIGPALSAFSSLVSLFKVDDAFYPKDESVDMAAIYGAVADQLLSHRAEAVYYPDLMPASLFEDKTSDVKNKLDGVSAALDKLRATYFDRLRLRAIASKSAADLDSTIKAGEAAIKTLAEIKALQEQIDSLGRTPAQRAKALKLKAQIDEKKKSIKPGAITDEAVLDQKRDTLEEVKRFSALNDSYIAVIEPVLKAGDDYLSAMVKPDANAVTPLVALMRAEKLRRLYSVRPQKTYALQLSVQKLSGTRKQHSNFFGTSVTFSGGVVVSYLEFAVTRADGLPGGAITSSGIVHMVEPFVKPKDINRDPVYEDRRKTSRELKQAKSDRERTNSTEQVADRER